MAFLDVVNPSLGEDDLGESAEDLSEDEELELNKPDLPFRYNLVYINSLFKFFFKHCRMSTWFSDLYWV